MLEYLRDCIIVWAWQGLDDHYLDAEYLETLQNRFLAHLDDSTNPALDSAHQGYLLTACHMLQRYQARPWWWKVAMYWARWSLTFDWGKK